MKTSLSRFLFTAAMLSLTLAATALSQHRKSEALVHELDSVPRLVEQWHAVADTTIDEETSNVLGATSYLSRSYQKQNNAVELFIAYYAQQRAGESIHSPKNCLPGSGWEIWQFGSAMIPVGQELIKVNRDSIEHNGDRFLMYYWYQSKREIIASEYLGKFLLMRDALFAGYTSGAIARIMIADRPGADEAATQFASLIIPHIRRCYGQEFATPELQGLNSTR
jgi:EpsI family protein